MAMTIVEGTRSITGGVDTHLDVHVAAALDDIGGLLGVESFEASMAGNDKLLGWLGSFGPVGKVGVEGTGSYGAGLARFLRAAGVGVVEVDRPNRQARRRTGKSDPADAVEAARAALSGRAQGAGRTRNGNVEAIRALDPDATSDDDLAQQSADTHPGCPKNDLPVDRRHPRVTGRTMAS
jgi:transposase